MQNLCKSLQIGGHVNELYNQIILVIYLPGEVRIYPHPTLLYHTPTCPRTYKNAQLLVFLRSFANMLFANLRPK